MAGPRGQKTASLVKRLFDRGRRFDFFQATRLLQLLAWEKGKGHSRTCQVGVGFDGPPADEPVQYCSLPSHTFPAGPIHEIEEAQSDNFGTIPPKMHVSFMGLTGPSGVLPDHYTSQMIERCHQRYKDYALRDFFDLFNHRTISLFYRASEKYRFPFAYERLVRSEQKRLQDDPFTAMLYSIVGLGTPGLRRRMEFDDEAVLFYGGLFSDLPRSAVSLEQALSDYLCLPVNIRQFVGTWLRLKTDDQSSMPTTDRPQGQNLSLGVTAIAGSRVWDVASCFRICVGPLNYAQFLQLTPGKIGLKVLSQFVRLYVGMEFDLEVQVILNKEDIPPCRPGDTSAASPRLGYNTWLPSRHRQTDADDAVFRINSI